MQSALNAKHRLKLTQIKINISSRCPGCLTCISVCLPLPHCHHRTVLLFHRSWISAISKQQAADEKGCSKVHIQLELFPHEIPIWPPCASLCWLVGRMSFLSRFHSNHCNLPPSIGADISLHQWTCAIMHFPGLVPNQPISPTVATLQLSWRSSWRFITWKIYCNILIRWNAPVVNSLELSRVGVGLGGGGGRGSR